MRERAMSRQRGAPNNGGLNRAIRYLGRSPKVAVATYVAVIIATLGQLAIPQLVQNVFDSVINGVQAGFTGTAVDESPIWWAMLAIVVFSVGRGIFNFAQSYLAQRSSQDVAFDLRNEIFAKVQHLSFSYHDRNRTGQLMIRATDDVEKVRLFLAQGLVVVVQAIVLLTGILIILFASNAALTWVVIPVLPIAFVLFMGFGAITQPLFGEVQKRLSALNTVLQENLAGIKVVKAFVRESSESHKFSNAVDDLLHQQLRVSQIFSFLFPLIFLVANLGQAAVLYFGGSQIINNTLTLGEWQKFSIYLAFAFFPIGQLGFIINLMAQANTSAGRIFEILDAKNDVTDKPNAQELKEIQGRVAFEDVTFRYYESGEPILSNVTFTAEPGQTVALLGATGSGKTTIINLIPRFYDVSVGAVKIDGLDVRDVTIESLRRQIGIVLQETTLFSGTIRENIAFGRPDASLEEITAAAKAARAHDFIVEFPQGYDTPVGERGSTLSGGQRQRVAIARALLLNPHILILDDSTSAVDVTTEAMIQEALDRLMEGRTSFVIAQRISTVLNADQILVLDKGRVVARGTHEELMEESEIYAEIYQSQLLSAAPTEDQAQDEEALAGVARG